MTNATKSLRFWVVQRKMAFCFHGYSFSIITIEYWMRLPGVIHYRRGSSVNVTSILNWWMRFSRFASVCVYVSKRVVFSVSAVEVMAAEVLCPPPSVCQTALHVTWKQDTALLSECQVSMNSLDLHRWHYFCLLNTLHAWKMCYGRLYFAQMLHSMNAFKNTVRVLWEYNHSWENIKSPRNSHKVSS